jgi:succinyl-CoA synthetase beta subunit
VHWGTTPSEARDLASQMLGSRLVTKQTGPEGKPCHQVLITERLFVRRECYFAVLMDRATSGPMLVASSKGGVDIEEVAHSTPQFIFREAVDIESGPSQMQLDRLASAIGFTEPKSHSECVDMMRRL